MENSVNLKISENLHSSEDLGQILEDARKAGLCVIKDGKKADYIPALAKADENAFGICSLGRDGIYIACGDSDTRFSAQSISKIINLTIAFNNLGYNEVFKHVMMEPSGDAFNSIIKLDTASNIPYNPMINAGAIQVASLLVDKFCFEDMLDFARSFCMDPDICLNKEVYESEFETGNRNRAIAFLLKSKGVLCADPEKTVDLYFKMCSLNVSARSLAGLGFTIANDGCTLSGERLVHPRYMMTLKSLMFTCGLYNESGEYGVKVGVPSKSGVGGGIVCAAKGPMGIGLYGPALDSRGNSIASVTAMEYISKALHLHVFDY